MLIRIILLLIFSFSTITFADSATLTDWSGLDNIQGPVSEWGNDFYGCANIWLDTPGVLQLIRYKQGILDSTYTYISSVHARDVNNDGRMDIVASVLSHISWWENVDGSGEIWIEHVVPSSCPTGTHSAHSCDINADGHSDLLGTGYWDNYLAWWENSDGFGITWIERKIDDTVEGPLSTFTADIDGDGDLDVLVTAQDGNQVFWYENTDGAGLTWSRHLITSTDKPYSVVASDIDGDGDIDVPVSEKTDMVWYENVDGTGLSWIKHMVDDLFVFGCSIQAIDVDQNGNMDILGTGAQDEIRWWENINGSGTVWIEHVIEEDLNNPRCIYAVDVDNDDDIDIVGTGSAEHAVLWWENIDGAGTGWTKHVIDATLYGSHSVFAEDMDSDGDIDFLGSAWSYDYNLRWWETLDSVSGHLNSSILYLGNDPGWDYLDFTTSIPTGTTLSIAVRASDDWTEMGEWQDTLIASGSVIGVLPEGSSYFQYRAILETSNADSTPTLHDITISWIPVCIGDTAEPIPPEIALFPFTPNPASAPEVRFELSEPASVRFFVFGLSGRFISEIHGNEYSPGYHEVLLGIPKENFVIPR